MVLFYFFSFKIFCQERIETKSVALSITVVLGPVATPAYFNGIEV
jgi:hypothetical protein